MREISLSDHRDEVMELLKYVPWLEKKAGKTTSKVYNENGLSENSVSFPVYDSTLLSFVKEAGNTGLIDRNYKYAYSEHFIKTVDDERRAIEAAGIKEAYILCDIFSSYILEGNIKGAVWSEGVKEGIFLDVLLKMKKLLEIWDAPLA